MELDISWKDLLKLDKKSLKKLIRNYDNECWERELEDKPAARYYTAEKKEIKYEACYTNNYSSKIFARARMNALQLEKQKSKSYKNYMIQHVNYVEKKRKILFTSQ